MSAIVDRYDLRIPTDTDPLRVLTSACLTGVLCGWDGTSYGSYPHVVQLGDHPRVTLHTFCPEHFAFGTPRALCDIHGGNGFDVLRGKAKVLTTNGEDWTAQMVGAAEKMLEVARARRTELAILMDVSAACGTQVIYDGDRTFESTGYQKGPGVCAAMLIQHGIPTIAQRDYASLERLLALLDSNHSIDPTKLDHHQTQWYCEYFDVQ